jgi:predicted exporter
LLIAQTRAAGFDLDAQERALGRLHALFDQISSEQGASGARMVALGPGVFAVDVRAAIKQDVARISLFAVSLVSFLLLVVYRSPRVLLLTLLPVVTGATAGVAAVSLAFGSVHGITLGFGATLLGEGVDYAIYLFTNAASGRGRDPAIGQLWRTLRLGVLTSVCGFGVMLLSDFSGLAQLGLFSITGLIVAFAVTRLVLPQLSPAGYRAQPLPALGPILQQLAHAAPALRYPLLVLVAVCAAMLAVRGASLWNDRLESLSPVPEADKQAYEGLQRDLGAPDARFLVVVSRPTQQAALEDAERVGGVLDGLQQAGALGGFQSPAQILPSDRTQQQRQQALPDTTILRRNLSEAARGLPFRVDLFQPFLQDVASAKGAAVLHASDLGPTGLKVRLDSLLAPRAEGWVAILSLRDVRDARGLAAALDALKLDTVHLLDLKQETDDMYSGYRRQALRFGLIGVAAIALLLLISLRSPRRAWDVLIPLLAALVVTSAALSMGGRQLTIFHLVGMLLVVGVGSNYTLFFERQNLSSGDPQRIVTSLALCNASTAIGFGLLALARAPVLSAIGTTVALGAFLSLAFAAVLARRAVR